MAYESTGITFGARRFHDLHSRIHWRNHSTDCGAQPAIDPSLLVNAKTHQMVKEMHFHSHHDVNPGIRERTRIRMNRMNFEDHQSEWQSKHRSVLKVAVPE